MAGGSFCLGTMKIYPDIFRENLLNLNIKPIFIMNSLVLVVKGED